MIKEVGAIVSISNEAMSQYPGMEFQVYGDTMAMCVRMMARPLRASVQTRRAYTVLGVEGFKVPWANHWWMRFLRWLGTKLRSEALDWISDATMYQVVSHIREIPEDTYEKIVIQIGELKSWNREPRLVLLGGDKTLYKLQSGFEQWMAYNPGTQRDRIFELEIVVSPWLAEGEVLVV